MRDIGRDELLRTLISFFSEHRSSSTSACFMIFQQQSGTEEVWDLCSALYDFYLVIIPATQSGCLSVCNVMTSKFF